MFAGKPGRRKGMLRTEPSPQRLRGTPPRHLASASMQAVHQCKRKQSRHCAVRRKEMQLRESAHSLAGCITMSRLLDPARNCDLTFTL